MKEEVFHSNFPTFVNSTELKELFDKIVQHFFSRGYTQRMLTEYIRIIGHFIYWVENEHYFFPITEEVIMSRFYTEHLPICQCPVSTGCRSRYPSALRHIIDVLRRIDWRKGTLSIHSSKGRRTHLLPLSQEIGQSIADYIIHDRPSSEVRNIFVQHRAPLGARLTSGAIGAIIRKTFKRCGITMPFSGSHVLRHTAATDMIRSGACIKEVADILGHRNINTTCIYTKVDLPTLASVALPWPGEVK